MEEDGLEMKTLNKDSSNGMRKTGTKMKLSQYLATIIVNIAPLTYGVSVVWPSSAIPQLQSKTDNPIGIDPITSEDGSWLGSLICVGAICFLPIYSYVSDKFGRKVGGYLVAIPFIVGWIISYTTKSISVLYIARFIIGLSSGGMLIVCPLYVGEIAQDSIRGTLGSFLLLFINGGMVIGYVMGAYISYHAFALICIILPIIFLLTFILLPETPIYLIKDGNTTGANKSLNWLRGGEIDIVEEELELITSRESKDAVPSLLTVLKELISNSGNRKAIIIGLVLVINQQFSGIFAITSYTQVIFDAAGSSMKSETATIVVGILQFIGSCAASLLMDRAGRRILLIISNAVMAICLLSIGIFFYMKHVGADTGCIQWLPVTSLSVYIVAYALGMGPVPFVIISEIFPFQTRGLAVWICVSTLWVMAFLVAKFFSTLSIAIGIFGCFWIFAIACALGTIFAVMFLPETKNKSLDVILKELNGIK